MATENKYGHMKVQEKRRKKKGKSKKIAMSTKELK
jgi:hypothetical protein